MTQHDTTDAGVDAPVEPAKPVEPGEPVGRPSAGRRGKGYFLPGFIALVALLAIGLFVGAGDLQHRPASTISGTDIASQIALGIQAQENLASAVQVSCPRQEPVRQGLTFQCTLGGRPPRTVQVTEVDNRGRVRWALVAP